MMRRKKVFSLLMACMLIAVLVLSACSKQETNDGAKEGDKGTVEQGKENQQPEEQKPEGTKPEEQKPVTLRLLTWFVGQYQQEFDLFHKKYPWITIEPLVVGGDGDMMAKQAALQAAGDSADLTWIQDLSSWIKDGLLEDLTPYVAADQTIKNADVAEGFIDAFKTGDKMYAMPFSKIAEWILVNKDMMQKKGLEMPSNDWTYDQFLDLAKKGTDAAAGEYGIANDALFLQQFKWSVPVANGNADNLVYMNGDLTQSVANNPAVINDLRWVQELTTKWHVMPTPEEAQKVGWDGNNAFLTGKALFALGADWTLPGLVKEAKFNWDILPMPKGKAKQVTTQILGPIGVLAASKNKEAAFKWISFQFELEAQKWMLENGSNTYVNHPDLDKYIEEVPLWKGKNVEAVKIANKMCCNLPGANVPLWSKYGGEVDNAFGAMLQTGGDLSSVIPAVDNWNKETLAARKELGW